MSVKNNTAAKKILPLKMLQLSVLTPFFLEPHTDILDRASFGKIIHYGS